MASRPRCVATAGLSADESVVPARLDPDHGRRAITTRRPEARRKTEQDGAFVKEVNLGDVRAGRQGTALGCPSEMEFQRAREERPPGNRLLVVVSLDHDRAGSIPDRDGGPGQDEACRPMTEARGERQDAATGSRSRSTGDKADLVRVTGTRGLEWRRRQRLSSAAGDPDRTRTEGEKAAHRHRGPEPIPRLLRSAPATWPDPRRRSRRSTVVLSPHRGARARPAAAGRRGVAWVARARM